MSEPDATTGRPPARRDARLVVILAIPLCAYAVGIVALPRPQGVVAEQTQFDRSVFVREGTIHATPTVPRRPVGATFGGVIALRGVDLPDAAVARGGRLQGALHFEVRGPVDDDWQVFVHVDAQGVPSRINADHFPLDGRYPTHLWQVGEHIVDRFNRVVPPSFPPGAYDVWVGLYRGEKRSPARAEDVGITVNEDRVKVGVIIVE